MKKVSDAGKGGDRRNEDKKRIDKNWDAIKWPDYSKEKKAKQFLTSIENCVILYRH